MNQYNRIHKVAVLGAGVMGAQIAAHFVNAGFQVILYDLPAQKGDPNSLVKGAIHALKTLSPSPLATDQTLQGIHAANYEHDLNQLTSCDLVIEAISERMDWKKSLFDKVIPHLHQTAILASNTSGLSIQALADDLPENIRSRFVGMHFFNPPRYMRLVELISHDASSTALLDHLETFLVTYLGKGVIRAKDSPNFIGNRIGVFALLTVMQYAEHYDIPPDVVDALTGSLIGRPKSGTFRTLDVVGLDTMAYVVNTMKQGLKNDPWSNRFYFPTWIEDLIHKGYLGQKTKQGVYLKKDRDILVIDRKESNYRISKPQIANEIQSIFKSTSSHWLIALKESSHPQAQFLWSAFRDLFHYSAYHLTDMANTVRDVDLAMRWGYGWQQGPFEIWQAAGWSLIADALDKTISVPVWVNEIDQGPYTLKGAWAPASKCYQARSQLPVYQRQIVAEPVLAEVQDASKTIFETDAVKLFSISNYLDVPVLSFKTKQNTISEAVLDGIQEAIERAEVDYKGLVLWQGLDEPFSLGANLQDVLKAVAANQFEAIERVVTKFQATAIKIRASRVPIVAAIQGFTLGGGAELAMHCARRVAALETYMGLVEVGVGILPAGGGTKELAYRAARVASGKSVEPIVTRYFEQIMKAEVSTSAREALAKDYMCRSDSIVLHSGELLYRALQEARHLSDNNYLAPNILPFAVAGRDVQANFQTHLVNLREGAFISDHDYLIGSLIAEVITGGGVPEGMCVTEEWMLEKEREMIMRLIKTKPTQQRIQHLLETGKPLRN
ncbi:MAG: 3-hydroxyacyl-CoA dehydrogenase/enoyl-CoA hydratase family protein [Gammaproteobacteria bacterium]